MHNVEVRVTDDNDGHHQPEYEEEYDVGGAIVCSALPIHRAAANNTKQNRAFALVNTHWNRGQKLGVPLWHAHDAFYKNMRLSLDRKTLAKFPMTLYMTHNH